MGWLAYPVLGLTVLTVVAAAGSSDRAAAGFVGRDRDVISPDRVRALTGLPGETVTLEVAGRAPGSGCAVRPAAGRIGPLGTEGWAWTAPPAPGFYPIHVVAPDRSDSNTLQAFVDVPYARLQGEYRNGYRIGRYPAPPARGRAGYEPPRGFVEVTRENEQVLVSPHFRLAQFLCKQPAGARRYIVLNERLLLALEYVLAEVNAAGHRATTFHVMSGYRTPAYNRSLGNVRYSQHQWGAAADIFIDENGDGVMDDLNGDGRSDIRDAEVLYRLIDRVAARPEAQGLIGGLGKYRATAAHGPFVHLDVRDRRARW
jgi:hypothetical protein